MTGENLEIEWNECRPYSYGIYPGKLKNGEKCSIDIDWNVKVYNVSGKQVGTDEIQSWYCSCKDVKNLIFELENINREMQ